MDVHSTVSRSLFAFVALLGGFGVVLAPSVAFPLVWLSPICALALVHSLSGRRTGLEDLSTGNWSLVWRYAVVMLLCGFVWETWGFWIEVKWIYSVPWLYRFTYAEMPIVGFAGYLPFGVAALLVCSWLCPGDEKASRV